MTAPRAAVGWLPRAPGVYRFRDARGAVLYVGRAVDLRRRVVSYWSDLGDRPHLAPMVGRPASSNTWSPPRWPPGATRRR